MELGYPFPLGGPGSSRGISGRSPAQDRRCVAAGNGLHLETAWKKPELDVSQSPPGIGEGCVEKRPPRRSAGVWSCMTGVGVREKTEHLKNSKTGTKLR